MDPAQKKKLDYCTRDYIERVLRLQPEFSNGIAGLEKDKRFSGAQLAVCRRMIRSAQKIMQGDYRMVSGEERIVIDQNHYVKLNFSSSGQQEVAWIINLLCYYVFSGQKTLFIVEEPESHLFPESQKYITEMIAMAFNQNNEVLLTTHSPYVLGTLNNLLYADQVGRKHSSAEKIIGKDYWIDPQRFGSWFVEEGSVQECLDHEMQIIENERIDAISGPINEEFDRLLDLGD